MWRIVVAMHDLKNKILTLTLEYIINDQTYWLTTGGSPNYFRFSEIPLSFFNGRELFNQELVNNCQYSTIYTFEDGVEFQLNDELPLEKIDSPPIKFVKWNEMTKIIRDNLPLEKLTAFYHNNWLTKKKTCKYEIPDGAYQVTAFLPPPDREGVCAIMHHAYHPPENTSWITFQLSEEEKFKEFLDQFIIEVINFNGERYMVDETHNWTPEGGYRD